jgi:hypothetical protein
MPFTRRIYRGLAIAVAARKRCDNGFNPEWFAKWDDRIRGILSDHFPSGSGFDAGTQIDLDKSDGDKLVFRTSFHHMNEGGFYDGWTDHTITATPSFEHGFHLKVSGRDRNGIKDYISHQFSHSLMLELEWEF